MTHCLTTICPGCACVYVCVCVCVFHLNHSGYYQLLLFIIVFVFLSINNCLSAVLPVPVVEGTLILPHKQCSTQRPEATESPHKQSECSHFARWFFFCCFYEYEGQECTESSNGLYHVKAFQPESIVHDSSQQNTAGCVHCQSVKIIWKPSQLSVFGVDLKLYRCHRPYQHLPWCKHPG